MIRYVLKIKSSTKLPDFVQIRDEKFVLLGYVRMDRREHDLSHHGLSAASEQFWAFVEQLPFGRIEKFEFGAFPEKS